MSTLTSPLNLCVPGTRCGAVRLSWTRRSWRSSTPSRARSLSGDKEPAMEDNVTRLAELQEKEGGEKRRKQADILIELAAAATLFHTPAPDCDAFADIMIDGHRETHRVRAQFFRRWLRHQYFKAARSGANADAVQVAVETVAAQAMFEGEEREVYCRIAADGGAIYLDIGD